MKIVETLQEMSTLRSELISPVSLMATLGGMHAGHEALLDFAREAGDTLVASLFLNPTQFGPNEDLARYPIDAERDLEIFHSHGVDVVFRPSVHEMYPAGNEAFLDPGPVGDEIMAGTEVYNNFWTLTPGLNEEAFRIFEATGIASNGPDDTYGNFDPDRISTLFDAMKAILDETGVDLPEGYTAQSVYTNDFIDPNIGL